MKKDYTKYSETSNNTEKEELIQAQLKVMSDDQHIISPELEETVLKAGGEVMRVDNTDPIQNNDSENKEPELPEIEEDHTGDIAPATITGCTKLNVRKDPSKDSEVVCIITEDSSITVSRDESTEDFYKVYTNVNEVLYEGYCMKKFISIE